MTEIIGDTGQFAEATPAADTPHTLDEQPKTRCGFIALTGRPNVGKSTLLNCILGERLAITSPKPQTTRHVIRGVHNLGQTQMVFLDTPGLHQPRHQLGRYMMQAASRTIGDADVVLLLIDARFRPYVEETEQQLIRRAAQFGKPLILVLNKVDLAAKDQMLPLIAAYAALHDFAAVVPVSARTGEGVEILLTEIEQHLPISPPLFPADDYTDQTEKILVSELIRKEVLRRLQQEIPHGTAVAIEDFQELNGQWLPCAPGEARARVQIDAVLLCDKKSHKGMLIGRQGQMIQAIGTAARAQIAKLLDCPCDLRLFVKVREDWRNKISLLNDLGYTGQGAD